MKLKIFQTNLLNLVPCSRFVKAWEFVIPCSIRLMKKSKFLENHHAHAYCIHPGEVALVVVKSLTPYYCSEMRNVPSNII